jgi:Family of unknown function (DUF5683)
VKIKFSIFIFLFLLWNNLLFCQTDTKDFPPAKDTLKSKITDDINPLSPAKAAFFSAILPGLGQVYNKKYWKVPIVYGGLGIAVYFYLDSDTKFQQFRDAYKNRLEGRTNDNLSFLDKDRLIASQKFYERNRDFSSFFIIAVYVLNIVDANVDAHLLQYNVNDKLSFKPDVINNDLNNQKNIALALNYTF